MLYNRRRAQFTRGSTRQRHEGRYPELVDGSRGRLVVLGCEVGGRWSVEAIRILKQLAEAKAREAPALLRGTTLLAWHRRWLSMLSVAAQTALAETLLAPTSPHLTELDGAMPHLGDVLTMLPELDPPEFSRLPLR